MGVFLAVDASTSWGGVAVGDPAGAVLAEVIVGVRSRHAESLVPALDHALGVAGAAIGDVDGVVVGGGPGSFTGVRIAGATAKGLVRALDVPMFAYSGLEALAASLGAEARPVCALFDARRGEVYAGCYRFPGFRAREVLLEPGPRPIDQVLSAVGAADPVYAGDGALRHRDRIQAAGGAVAPAHFSAPRAGALLWLRALDPGAGRVADAAAWEPWYLRESGAERGVRG